MKNCVVIPIYKEHPNQLEIKSFNQVLKVLGEYPIFIVTYRELNLGEYFEIQKKINKKIEIRFFDKSYFDSIDGYNCLCLSLLLYETFAEFDYMLIYQLDAYVFSNQLDEWCSKGYDYIGAPWFEENKSHEQGAELWAVGNGGFSLRKISAFIQLFESKLPAYNFKYLCKKSIREKKGVLWLLKSYIFGFENNFYYLLNNWDDAEDLFYCLKLADTNYRLKIPEIKIAIDFAFEQSPHFLFKSNGSQLPFGCHAWEKYEYKTFWNKHI